MNLMTPDEVAGRLNVSRKWLLDQCRAGNFPFVRMGRFYRFDPDAVRSWIDSQGAKES